MDIDPYSSPRAVVADLPDHALVAQNVSISELAAFTGDSEYPKKWLAKHQGQARFAGFNVWAAIFGIQWFFFRKLHFQGLLSLFFEVGVPFFFSMAIAKVIGPGQVAVLLTIGSALAIRVSIGYWANVALYSEAVRVIRRIDAMNLDNTAHLQHIMRAGGISVPSLLLAYVLLGMLRFAFPRIGLA